MKHPDDGALNDLVDGRLDSPAADRVLAHLEHCAACTERVASIRNLNDRLAGLPRAIAPRRDLRPGIRDRIAGSTPDAPAAGAVQPPAAHSTHRSWRRAAAVLLALAGAGTAVWLGLERGAPVASAGDESRESTTTIGSYASAADELARSMEARKVGLSPRSARALDASLASLDVAILELERARRSGVHDPELLRQLEARHRTRLELLRSAAHLLEES